MRTLMRNSLLASLVSLTCGCGGDDSSRTGADAPVPYDPCEESRSLDRVMVADFEMQPAVDWSTNSDGTTTNLSPVPTNTLITAIEAPKCPDEASAGSGFQVIATGLQGFGYTFTFNNLGVLQGTGATHFDAAEWDGISMWVRKGTGPSASSIFASVADRFTEPSPAAAQLFSAEEAEALLPPGKCPAASMGGPCYCNFDAADVDDDGTTDPLLSQCDRFGAGIGISTEWRFFKVPFARMRQRAYGRPSMLSMPDTRILGLEFGLDGENWDFWLDELAFYRDAEVAVTP
jgi:hypothetical protein